MKAVTLKLDHTLLADFLEENFHKYNHRSFIENDPVCIPHAFTKKEDIEIAGFLAATLAWGQRKQIIESTRRLMALMDNRPYEFIIRHSRRERAPFRKFVYRTFSGEDCAFFVEALQNIYINHNGLEQAFSKGETMQQSLHAFKKTFFSIPHRPRTQKHVSDPLKNSASKRLCMYHRWMVRSDTKGVDFGIWKTISPRDLHLPLDVHTGRVSRAIGLLKRKQDDWVAVEEVTSSLRMFSPHDPVKYDFALFGAGVNGILY